MIKFNCLDNVEFIKNQSSFCDVTLTLGCNNEFILLNQTDKTNNTNHLNILSDQNKIIIDYFATKNNNDNEELNVNVCFYEFLHYVFFPIFFLNKTFDDVLFIFKKPKNLNKIYDEFLNFLFNILNYNNIKYLIINNEIKTITINNFLKYSRISERFKKIIKIDENKKIVYFDDNLNTNDKTILDPKIDNGHNYYLPKELIFLQKNNNNKIIIPISKNTKNFNLLEHKIYNSYGITLKELSAYNVEIVCLEEFKNFYDLLNFLKNIKYVITVENNDMLPYLIFTPIGTSIFISNNDKNNHFDNYIAKIINSMFFNNFIFTNNLIKELRCIN